MKHLDVRHCWLHEELQNGNYRVKRVDMLTQSLRRRTAEVLSRDCLPHNDSEERKLQCSRDDAERDACSKG